MAEDRAADSTAGNRADSKTDSTADITAGTTEEASPETEAAKPSAQLNAPKISAVRSKKTLSKKPSSTAQSTDSRSESAPLAHPASAVTPVTKFALPDPNAPLPPPQAPPQFIHDDSPVDRNTNKEIRRNLQQNSNTTESGYEFSRLGDRKHEPQSEGKSSRLIKFFKNNIIVTLLTVTLSALAGFLIATRELQPNEAGGLDLTLLTTGRSLNQINQLINDKKYDSALTLCNAVNNKDPRYADAYHARGQAHLALHHYREAVDDLTTAESYNPRSLDIHSDLAAALYNAQEFPKAKREYEKVLVVEPKNAAAFFGKGLCEESLGLQAEALEDFKNALQNRSDYAAANEEIGSIYFAQGDLRKSYEEYTKAIKLDPKVPRFYFNRGTALQKDHQWKLALADFSKAIQLEPTRPEFYNNRGLAYLEDNEVAKAITDFSSAIDLDPRYTIAQHNLMVARERLRR